MAIKNILVDFNGSESSKSAVKLARLMMDKFDAHITGALTYAPSEIGTTLRPYASQDLNKIIETAEADHRKAIHAAFFEVLDLAEGERVHWVETGGDVDYSLIDLARCYDIVLIGQYSATRETRNLVPHPDMVALNSGRPVLVVPADMSKAALNSKAMLAWDGGKAAARALADALDILAPASDVSVVSVGEGTAEVLSHLHMVTHHLQRHGFAAEAEIIPRAKRPIGTVLLEEAARQEAGLLIMGAYEHSKFLEDIWGGATRSAIHTAKIPVLLSH